MLSSAAGQALTGAQIETIRESIRGNIAVGEARRKEIKTQNSTVIAILTGKLDISYLWSLRSASKKFKWGMENRCLLSAIARSRDFVANPNAEK